MQAKPGAISRTVRRKLSPGWLLPFVTTTLLLPLGVLGQSPQSTAIEPERFVFLLEYVATDYELAVQDGEIINEFEYEEMRGLSALLVDHFDDLRRLGASEEIRAGLLELRHRIEERGPPSDVRAQGSELANRLLTELEIRSVPDEAPDPERGRDLFRPNCTPCHGETGRGDGPSSPGMEPQPASFHDPRMDHLSPHQVFGAITYGVPGTAMPSFRLAFCSEEIWDLAFLVMSLRDEPQRGSDGTRITEQRDEGTASFPPAVLSLRVDPDPRVRRWAAWSLGRSGTISPAATDALLAALADDDELVREYAASALGGFGAVIAPRLTDTIAGNPTARPHAEAILVAIGGPAVPELVRLLEQGGPVEQTSVVRILTEIGPGAEAAVPHLVAALARTTSRARGVKLAVALGRVGKASVPQLLELFENAGSPLARELAGSALGVVGPDAIDAVPVLLDALADPNARIRFTAASALGEIRSDLAVTALADRVSNDTNRTARLRSIEALGKIGSGADSAVPLLIELFAGEDDNLAAHAARSLAGIGVASLPQLMAALRNEDPRTRAYAARALGWTAVEPARSVPPLIAMLRDEDELVRDAATTVLVGLGEDAVPYLAEALTDDSNWRTRGNAALALGRMIPPSDDALPSLTAALDDGHETVRHIVCWSVGMFGGRALPALSRLRAVAQENSDPRLRRIAIWALGNVGPAAASALPALEALLDDPDPSIREEAEEALQKLRGIYEYAGAATEDK